MGKQDQKSASKDTTAEKEHYECPQLIVYGHIREITQTVGADSLALDLGSILKTG